MHGAQAVIEFFCSDLHGAALWHRFWWVFALNVVSTVLMWLAGYFAGKLRERKRAILAHAKAHDLACAHAKSFGGAVVELPEGWGVVTLERVEKARSALN